MPRCLRQKRGIRQNNGVWKDKKMQLETFIHDDMPEEAKRVREAVFVEEQGFENEFDDMDERCRHIVGYIDKKPVATCRFMATWGESIIGRLAVLPEYRGLGIGTILMSVAEKAILKLGGSLICIHAQEHAVSFYEKCGFTATPRIIYVDGGPHIVMYKKLR